MRDSNDNGGSRDSAGKLEQSNRLQSKFQPGPGNSNDCPLNGTSESPDSMLGYRSIIFKKPILFVLVSSIPAIAFDIASIIVHIKHFHGAYFPPLITIIVVIASVIWFLVDSIFQAKSYSPTICSLIKVREVVKQLFLFCNLAVLIIAIIALTSEESVVPPYNENNVPVSTTVSAIDSFQVAAQGLFGISICMHSWWPVFKLARYSLATCSICQFITGTLMIVMNRYNQINANSLVDHKIAQMCFYNQHCGSIVIALSVLGLALCLTIREGNRLNHVHTRFINFYCAFAFTTFFILVAYLALSIHNLEEAAHLKSLRSSVANANIALSGIAVSLNIVSIVSSLFLQSQPPSFLSVECIDISKYTDAQKAAYASLINRYGKKYPSAPSGESALSLMEAYASASMPGMNCVILRVFKPNKNETKSGFSYEQIRAWQDLDKERILPLDLEASIETSSISTLFEEKNSPEHLSKNRIKRMKKKAATNGQKRGQINFPLENPKSEEDIKKEIEFNSQLMSTEALVMLTRIDDYDLTTSIDNKFMKFIQKVLGSKSPLKYKWARPLVVRMGLLAFHWPFRQATFYTAPSRRPVARSAAVLRAIAEWNQKLPRSEKCTMLLDPRYANEETERAIQPSGWHPTPLPASHIVDLRPYRGKTMQDYIRAIKYRNQMGTFSRANGELIEKTEFSQKECAKVMELWHNIAEKRTSEGHTAVLVEPKEEFLRCLGNEKVNGFNQVSNKTSNDSSHKKYRSLLFLEVDGKAIASCVLFRLGDTLTSDLQGLDHELARPYKAYFVMMQHTIDIALKEGMSFVDFGPTTAKPKLDIGCKSLPLMGGIYSRMPLMTVSLKLFAKGIST